MGLLFEHLLVVLEGSSHCRGGLCGDPAIQLHVLVVNVGHLFEEGIALVSISLHLLLESDDVFFQEAIFLKQFLHARHSNIINIVLLFAKRHSQYKLPCYPLMLVSIVPLPAF